MIDVINGTELGWRGSGGAVVSKEENQEGKNRLSCKNQVVKVPVHVQGHDSS